MQRQELQAHISSPTQYAGHLPVMLPASAKATMDETFIQVAFALIAFVNGRLLLLISVRTHASR